MEYLEIIANAYSGYANYLWQEITFGYDYKPWWQNYFYLLIAISLFFFGLEVLNPWRKNQSTFRKDFWLDFFYMFFNFFLFSLIIYNAFSEVMVDLFTDFISLFGVSNWPANYIASWPIVAQLILMFFLADFIQYWTHRLLHRVPWLWEFHKVHHSVEQMGFAAHLRFHWMETFVYKSIQYIPLSMIGYGIEDYFVIYLIQIVVGHFNHSNWKIPLGPLKFLLNNPQMHIWHHAEKWPENHQLGINFGITLSLWDYIFGTASIPHDGRDIKLGFDHLEEYPSTFLGQATHGFSRNEN